MFVLSRYLQIIAVNLELVVYYAKRAFICSCAMCLGICFLVNHTQRDVIIMRMYA